MNTFHFDPSRIHDPILRAIAPDLYHWLKSKENRSPFSTLRHVESEGSDDFAEREVAL